MISEREAKITKNVTPKGGDVSQTGIKKVYKSDKGSHRFIPSRYTPAPNFYTGGRYCRETVGRCRGLRKNLY